MASVLKIKFGDSVRRWTLDSSQDGCNPPVTFQELEATTRRMFNSIPLGANLSFHYVDEDSDEIELADDPDIYDACILQRLNPLWVEVRVLGEAVKIVEEKVLSPKDNFQDAMCQKSNTSQDLVDTLAHLTHAIQSFGRILDPNAAFMRNMHLKVKEISNNIVHEVQAIQSKLKGEKYCEPEKVEGEPASSDGACSKASFKSVHPVCPFLLSRTGFDGSCEVNVTGSGLNKRPSLHYGVECDGCGMYPIEGIRYKLKDHKYDLCSSCFDKKGNENDYEKFEQPWFGFCHSSCPARTSKRTDMEGLPPNCYGPNPSNLRCPYLASPKLDAKFVNDVTIPDGITLAPCAKFTKTWRLKNVGIMPWPQGTELTFIEGDLMSAETPVNLQLPVHGLPCGDEIDISVDLVAPSSQGLYTSFWQLRTPRASTGIKFGNIIWLAVQVLDIEVHLDACDRPAKVLEEMRKEDNSKAEVYPMTGILPSEGSDSKVKHPDVTEASKSMESSDLAPDCIKAVHGIPMEKLVEEGTDLDQLLVSEQNPVAEDLGVGKDVVKTTNPSMETLLESLELMGFHNRDLNILLLEKNDLDLQLTLDGLLVSAGFGSLVKDLQEMGFDDECTNLWLLIKNNGSIKRAVRELVEMETV